MGNNNLFFRQGYAEPFKQITNMTFAPNMKMIFVFEHIAFKM